MKALQKILFALGLVFLALLIGRLGVRELWQQFTLLGWGLLPIVLAEGVAEWCHAVSWRYCLGEEHRQISLLRLFQISMAGYAITFVTPTASLAGEVTKGALLASTHKGPQVVTALLLGKISFALAHVSFVAIGFLTVMSQVEFPPAVRKALLAGSAVLLVGIVIFLLLQKCGKLGWMLRCVTCRSRRLQSSPAMQKLSHSVNEIDEALKLFYQHRPWDLLFSVLWHWVGFAIGIFSAWYFLKVMFGAQPLEVAASICFSALWFDLVTFAVPLNLGTLEGSRMLIFKALHFDPVAGMTFGLATRAAQLFWVAFGMINYGRLIADQKRKLGCQPTRNCSV